MDTRESATMRWEVFMGRKRRRFSPEFKAES
ncbi:MAG: hypothetical protein ACI91F_001347, partial [Candidatus Binatia bacterium]